MDPLPTCSHGLLRPVDAPRLELTTCQQSNFDHLPLVGLQFGRKTDFYNAAMAAIFTCFSFKMVADVQRMKFHIDMRVSASG